VVLSMIRGNVQKILSILPGYVELVAAAKSRSVEEILEAIDSGVKIIGENYVQEAEEKFRVIGTKARWHFIGHLQKNKVKKAVKIFDMIETVDSIEIAQEISKACASINKTMPVLIEVNSHVLPFDAETIIKNISGLPNIKLAGLMTMGPVLENPEDCRPYFKETKALFDKIRINHDIKYLSMGMSGSYHIAIQEGANLVRIGTAIFKTG
jgi:pyridoxal phosphate enzyme (YggS family)